jgi:biopolymer transport protein ExbB/TolQ/biopolymer transport protein ExbD
MRHKCVRTTKLFCSLDRTPFVAVSATLFAVFVFALILTTGRPGFGRSDLPKVNNPIWAPGANEEGAIVLAVMCDGRVFWGQDPISVGDLPHKLSDRVERTPEATIYLAVDAHATYGNVAKVLAVLRSVGAARVVFLVDQRKDRTSGIDYSQPHVWDLVEVWRSMDSLERADFMLLVLMLANTGAIICFRLYRNNTARRQSRTFIRDAALALRDGKFDEVITIAARNSESHVASIVAEGLAAYASVSSEFTNTEAIATARRAFQRSSKSLAAHLKVGLNTIVTIGSSAPFIGFLGTVDGIQGSFGAATTGPAGTVLARWASQIAQALILGAMGLLVSILAVWCFNYLHSHIEVFEREMSNAELEAVTCLEAHPHWRKRFEQSYPARRILAVPDASVVRNREVPYDRHRPLLLAMWCCVLYLVYVLARGVYWSWFYP